MKSVYTVYTVVMLYWCSAVGLASRW